MVKELQVQSERIESILGQHGITARVTGGTATPRWVRFQVAPEPNAIHKTDDVLRTALAKALRVKTCRVIWRGAVFDVVVPQDKPVRLKMLLAQLEPSTIPPLCAVLGLASHDGAPLLARLPGEEVHHIAAPRELLPVIALSLAAFNKPSDLTIITNLPELARLEHTRYMTRLQAIANLARLIKARTKRENWRSPVVGVLNEPGTSSEILETGPGLAVYIVEASDQAESSLWRWGLSIARYGNGEMMATDRTGRRYTFYPATLDKSEHKRLIR